MSEPLQKNPHVQGQVARTWKTIAMSEENWKSKNVQGQPYRQLSYLWWNMAILCICTPRERPDPDEQTKTHCISNCSLAPKALGRCTSSLWFIPCESKTPHARVQMTEWRKSIATPEKKTEKHKNSQGPVLKGKWSHWWIYLWWNIAIVCISTP